MLQGHMWPAEVRQVCPRSLPRLLALSHHIGNVTTADQLHAMHAAYNAVAASCVMKVL